MNNEVTITARVTIPGWGSRRRGFADSTEFAAFCRTLRQGTVEIDGGVTIDIEDGAIVATRA